MAAGVFLRGGQGEGGDLRDGAIALVFVILRPLEDGGCLRLQLDRAGQHAFLHREARLHGREHRVGDLVEERVDLLLGLAGHGDFVRHDDLRDRELVLLGVLAQFLHRGVGILRLALLGRRVALPLVEPAAGRVILQFVDRLVAGHEFAGHRVRVREVALGRVVDDVGQREIERLVAELHRIGLRPASRSSRRGTADRPWPVPCRSGPPARRARCRGPCRWRSGCRTGEP